MSCTDHVHDHPHSHSHSHASPGSGANGVRDPAAATKLRETQAPLKASYKDDPSAALITLRSSGSLDATGITCSLDGPNAAAIASAHRKVAGLHPKAGGEDFAISGELCSGDMLLEALVACAGVTLKAVATALDIPVVGGEVRAEGDLDFRGTLGVSRDAPVGFKSIRLLFDLKMERGREVDDDTIEKLGKLTERYCVVWQTINKKPDCAVRIDGRTEPEPGLERIVSWAQRS